MLEHLEFEFFQALRRQTLLVELALQPPNKIFGLTAVAGAQLVGLAFEEALVAGGRKRMRVHSEVD